ncbi:uncharacterized protein A4U43_C03F17230 [Asparagus officinalis]|uniref:K Homology domain-containing protein n=1 Tax=Asparagus officinalis TaxID=4686 RepID=A0A5P1FCJ2_ASPOF|nr:uncharacterized protein A4U43_C03F17230 [Asparagus officinalis]
MSFPSKRPFEKNASDPNGRGKWRKTAPSASQMPQGAVVFRVLCPVSKSGGIIGKGGGIVSRIRQETGAKVRLEEIIPGCEERIIVITGSDKDMEVSSENAMKSDENAGGSGGDQDDKTSGEDKEEKEDSSVLEGSKSDKSASSAQKALLLIFERIIEVEPKDGDVEEEASKDFGVTVRLLVQSSQITGVTASARKDRFLRAADCRIVVPQTTALEAVIGRCDRIISQYRLSPAGRCRFVWQHGSAWREPDGVNNVSIYVLVSSNQIGCLIGKACCHSQK